MKDYAPFVLLSCALVAVLISFIGDDSYSKMRSLQAGLEYQKETNQQLNEKARELRRKVYNLQRDDRELEKTARQELRMQRRNELLVIFE